MSAEALEICVGATRSLEVLKNFALFAGHKFRMLPDGLSAAVLTACKLMKTAVADKVRENGRGDM